MMRFGSRPDAGRSGVATTAAPRTQALMGMVLGNGSPNYQAINQYIEANEIWKAVKPFFMKAQNGKCGHCEVKLTESTGDVEHYRPKDAVWSLLSPGRELEDLVNVRGRRYRKTCHSGYWWLTYSWDNCLVACPTCNQKWKNALFPIQGRRSGHIPELNAHVLASRRQRVPVGTEAHACRPARVPAETGHLAAGRNVPEPDCAKLPGGG